MIIHTGSDQTYIDYTKALVMSIFDNAPENDLHITLVNPSPMDLKRFKIFQALYITRLNQRCQIQLHDVGEKSQVSIADITANMRVHLLWATGKLESLYFPQRHQSLIWFDADTIVRDSLEKLDVKAMGHHTVATSTPEFAHTKRVDHEYLISTVGVNTSKESMAFVDEWRSTMMDLQQSPGYIESIMTVQEAYALIVNSQQYDYFDLGYEFSDKFFKDESPVWEGQGPRKKIDLKYGAEMDHYRNRFQEITEKEF